MVGGRADHLVELREERSVGERAVHRLGHAEVDDLRHRRVAVARGDEEVRGFEVAVDDALLMRVLERVADVDEKREPLRDGEFPLVAVGGDGHAAHQLHDEIRAPVLRRAGVEDLGDVRVIHHGQRLPLLLEAGDDFLRVHAHLDDLQRDAAFHRLHLIRHPDGAEASLAQWLQELVRPDALAAFLRLERIHYFLQFRVLFDQRRGHKAAFLVRCQQPLHPRPQRKIVIAHFIQIGRALAGWHCRRHFENLLFDDRWVWHRRKGYRALGSGAER